MTQPAAPSEHAPADAAEQLRGEAAVLVGGLLVLALAATVATIALTGQPPTLVGVTLLAIGIAIGDLLEIELPFRRGGSAIFGLSEAALAAGLLLLPAPDVAVGVAVGIVPPLLLDRSGVARRLANLATYSAGGSCAALAAHLLAPPAGAPEVRAVLAAAVGVGVFLLTSLLAVTRLISAGSGRPWLPTLLAVVHTAVVTSVGSAALGVLAVVLWEPAPWALPALAVPVAVLHAGARLDVRARLDRERSAAFVETERRLSEAATPRTVSLALAEGATLLLGGEAAVWDGRRWTGDVPTGSRPCPVDPDLDAALVADGPALGPAVTDRCAAMGYGGGVVVVWGAALDREARGWLERLGRSARLHLERASANLALEQERATVRAVVDGTADGIFAVDGTGLLRLWNPGMARLSGIAAGHALGHPIAEVLGEGPWETEGVQDVLRDGDVVWRVSLSQVTQRVPEGSGRVGSELLVAVVHDVSAERRAERMRDDMLAIVSHELRTPLTPIKASAQLLQVRWDRMSPDTRVRLLGQIDERAGHLARLVDDLLLVGQLSSTSSSAPPVHLADVDLAQTVRATVEQLASAHPGHRLGVTAPDTLGALSDATRIRQILDNIIDNACKFSPEGSAVSVRLRRDDEVAVLEVRDEGRGIPAGDLERVFERFERVEDPLHMTTSGAGLGLFIVRALVEALGGRVWIDSRPGAGTTVTVRLPLTPAARRAADEPVVARPAVEPGS